MDRNAFSDTGIAVFPSKRVLISSADSASDGGLLSVSISKLCVLPCNLCSERQKGATRKHDSLVRCPVGCLTLHPTAETVTVLSMLGITEVTIDETFCTSPC